MTNCCSETDVTLHEFVVVYPRIDQVLMTFDFDQLKAIFLYFLNNRIACNLKTAGQILIPFYAAMCLRFLRLCFCKSNKSWHIWRRPLTLIANIDGSTRGLCSPATHFKNCILLSLCISSFWLSIRMYLRLLVVCSCHPSAPLVATGSGQRHFAVALTADSDIESADSDDDDASHYDNSLKIWRIN